MKPRFEERFGFVGIYIDHLHHTTSLIFHLSLTRQQQRGVVFRFCGQRQSAQEIMKLWGPLCVVVVLELAGGFGANGIGLTTKNDGIPGGEEEVFFHHVWS